MKDVDENASEDQKKFGFLKGLRQCLASNRKLQDIGQYDDQASHWLLKIAMNNENKGDFVMIESQLFSARLYETAELWADQKTVEVLH